MRKKLIIKSKRGSYALPVEDIVFMEKRLRKILVHTMTQSIEFYGRFSEIIPLLDNRFLHCHRSYVINMDKIVVMSYNQIFVTTNKGIYFGRDTYGRAKKIFDRYLEEKRSQT